MKIEGNKRQTTTKRQQPQKFVETMNEGFDF